MGLFDVISSGLNEAKKYTDEIKEYKFKFCDYSDQRLAWFFYHGSFKEKTAASSVLKDRYGDEEEVQDILRYYR